VFPLRSINPSHLGPKIVIRAISLSIVILPPYFKLCPVDPPFRTREETLIPEDETLSSVVRFGNKQYGVRLAVEHDFHDVVVVVTFHAQLLVIPPGTKIKDIKIYAML
jgi:hypothetical protein